MSLYGSAPVLLLSLLLYLFSCADGASSQRKIQRNVGDVKTSVNFDCPEEFGYYPHPTDCTQYYVCVFGGALLESCTGGLMYSHELQTCDWPRNVGCDGIEISSGASSAAPSPSSRGRERDREPEREQPRRYTPPPPPPQPAAVVTSRGQPRQLQHSQQEIIKQQQQLYTDAEEALPPAEEVESDRQQRVYRGQPSTVGQVQRDRDGLRHSNAIPTYTSRGEKIGVISFGTQNQHYSLMTDLDDKLLTNDLIFLRRRKRQAYNSQQQQESNLWHGSQHVRNYGTSSRRTSSAKKKHNNFSPSVLEIAASETDEEFRPFVPNYPQKTNSYQHYSFNHLPGKVRKSPGSSQKPFEGSYAYINFGSTALPGNAPEEFRHTVEYHNSHPASVALEPAYSYVVPQKQSPRPVTKLSENTIRLTEAVTRGYENTSKSKDTNNGDNDNDEINEDNLSKPVDKAEESTNDNSSSVYDEELDHYDPPPEFFNDKNKYEDVVNPFADPNFDFDGFLATFTTTTTTTTTTPKPTVTSRKIQYSGTQIRSDAKETSARPIMRIISQQVPQPKNNFQGYYIPKDSNSQYLIENIRPKEPRPPVINYPSEFVSSNQVKSTTKLPLAEVNKTFTEIYPPYQTEQNTSPRNYFNNKNYQMISKPITTSYYDRDAAFTTTKTSVDVQPSKQTGIQLATIQKQTKPNNANDEYYYDYEDESPKKAQTITENSTNKVPVHQNQSDEYEYYYDDDYDDTIKLKSNNTKSKNSPIQTTTNRSIDSTKAQTITTTTKISSRGKQRHNTTQRNNERDSKRGHTKIKSEESSVAPASAPVPTSRTSYNNTQYNSNINHYEPYYALYDDDVYRDTEYSQNNYNTNTQRSQAPPYRGTPATAVQTTSLREEIPKRGNTVYLQNSYPQDIYQQSSAADYNEQNRYETQVDDQNSYRQSNRQPSSLRGDRNEINEVEDAIPKRITPTTRKTTTTTRTTTTTQRIIPTKKSSQPPQSEPLPVLNENLTQETSVNDTTLLDDSKYVIEDPITLPLIRYYTDKSYNSPDKTISITQRRKLISPPSDTSLHVKPDTSVTKTTLSLSFFKQLTTESPAFHYVTKATKSTDGVFSTKEYDGREFTQDNTTPFKVIVPTTYSPPKFFLKSLLPKSVASHTVPVFSFRSTNKFDMQTNTNTESTSGTLSKAFKTLKAVRKLINPISLNHELYSVSNISYDTASDLLDDEKPIINNRVNYRHSTPVRIKQMEDVIENNERLSSTTVKLTITQPSTNSMTNKTSTITASTPTLPSIFPSTSTTPGIKKYLLDDYISEKLSTRFQKDRYYIGPSRDKHFRTTDEIPLAIELLDSENEEKQEPDEPPAYKPKSIPKQTPTMTKPYSIQNNSSPARVSRVNAAIKSLIATGTTRRSNSKCIENQSSKCNDTKQRASTRGRGTAHYASNGAQIVNNEVTVNTNRGTPAPRSRPTLKPSTSIVSKAQEFVDIYRYPPRRPDPIYPQPQPDKTAAKCRKDVCLLPDCSCGGKEIPGNIPTEETPQMVLITFDDAVNDLNKEYYIDLFEKGRKNPNGCPISATFYVSHEWTDYGQVQSLYADGHELASHTVSHSFGEQFSQKKWTREVAGQREILSAYGGVKLEDVRGMRAPFLSVGGNKMFKMLYDSNFTYDSSMPIYENKPPSWPYTLDYKLFHDCMIPPCPTRSYPGVWEVPMVMWQDLNGGRCSMGDACSNPPDAEGVFKMLTKNFQRHYTTNRAPFGLFYHAAWFTQPHHKEGFINFIDSILAMKDVWLVTNWQALQWVRDPTPVSRLNSFQPFQCNYSDRPKRCNNPKVCNLWHKSGVRYMRTCQPCPDIYPWTGNTGIRSSRIDNDIED